MSVEIQLPQPCGVTVCPICTRGTLVVVGENVWDCSRKRCNNQFFYDEWEGTGLYHLNVRDKPRRPLLPESAGLFGVRVTMVLFGLTVMYAEGQHQPSPGVGFVIGMALMIGAVIPWRTIP